MNIIESGARILGVAASLTTPVTGSVELDVQRAMSDRIPVVQHIVRTPGDTFLESLIKSPDRIQPQERSSYPEFIEIATPEGQIQVLDFTEFQQQPNWSDLQTDISSAIEVFNLNRDLWENQGFVIDNYRIVVPGRMSETGDIQPTPTPPADSNTKPSLYFSIDGGGYLFIKGTGDQTWDMFTSQNTDLLAVTGTDLAPDYVVLSGGQLFALNGVNTDSVSTVARGIGDPETKRIVWERVVRQNTEVVDSTVAEQMTVEELRELGDYTSGVRFNYQGINWEFVGDFESIQFDASRMNLPRFTNLLKSLIDRSFQPWRYENAVVDTMRISFNFDDRFVSENTGALYIGDNMFGLNNPRLDVRTISQRIVYNTELVSLIESFTSIEEREMVFGYLIALQMSIGDRIGPTTNWRVLNNNYAYEIVGLPTDRMPTIEEFLSKLGGFGIKHS